MKRQGMLNKIYDKERKLRGDKKKNKIKFMKSVI